MAGAIIIIIVLVVFVPLGFLVTMSLVAAVLGGVMKADVDDVYAGTEDLDISQR